MKTVVRKTFVALLATGLAALVCGCDFFYPNYGKNSNVSISIGKSARAIDPGAETVDYYTVQINDQYWGKVTSGMTVQSEPIMAGDDVAIKVTAFGQHDDTPNVALAVYESVVKMKQGGMAISINMKDFAIQDYVQLSFPNAPELHFASPHYYKNSTYAPCWDDTSRVYFVLPSGITYGNEEITEWEYNNNNGYSGTAKPGDLIKLYQSGSGYTFIANPGNQPS